MPAHFPEDLFADSAEAPAHGPGKIRDRRFAGEAAHVRALARILEIPEWIEARRQRVRVEPHLRITPRRYPRRRRQATPPP